MAKEKAAQPDKGKRIKVRATRTGYYELIRRRAGDVFVCYESEFSENWMERVAANTAQSHSTSQSAINVQRNEALLARAAAAGAGAGDAVDDSVI